MKNMKKNNFKAWAAVTSMVMLLTGCGSSFPDMTEEQEDMVGEYAAMLLIKYDANNRSRLVSREDVEAREAELLKKQQQEEARKAQKEKKNKDKDQTATVQDGQKINDNTVDSMEAFFALPDGVTITYAGNELCSSYPANSEESEYPVVDAVEGRQLLVLKFNLSNQSPTEQAIDILSQNVTFRVTVNGDYSRNTLLTMMEDDFSTYTGTLSAGESVNVVLLTEVDYDVAEHLASVSLKLKNESNTYTIQL